MGFFDTYSPLDERPWWERVLDDHPDLRSPTDQQVWDVFESRGITEDVWQERAYVPYDAGDWDAVLRHSGYDALTMREQNNVQRKVLQRPGLIMQRHGFDGHPLLAQLRPFKWRELGFDVKAVYGAKDEGVLTHAKRHRHNPRQYHSHTETGHVFSDYETEPWKQASNNGFNLEKHILTAHLGFAPPVGWKHPFQLQWQKHEEASHESDVGLRLHSHDRFAKYLYPPGKGAKALDVHPRARPLLEVGGSVVYFAMEGALKNDAILSTGAAVVNCGSVTLWNDPALEGFAKKYLAPFRTVVVVPDSDWLFNPMVSHQACQLHDELAGWVQHVVIAAPPQKECLACAHQPRFTAVGELPPAEHKLGVDDFLGQRCSLQQLEISYRESPSVLDRFRRELEENRVYANRRDRDMAVLATLLQRARDNGIVLLTYRGVGKVINRSRDQIGESLRYWQGKGVLNFEPSPGPGTPTIVQLAADLLQPKTTITLGEYLEPRLA